MTVLKRSQSISIDNYFNGGFTQENHSGLASVIALPEIDASLPLAEVYERVELAS